MANSDAGAAELTAKNVVVPDAGDLNCARGFSGFASCTAILILPGAPGGHWRGEDTVSLMRISDFKLSGVTARSAHFEGRDALEVTMPSSAYQDPTRETLVDRDFMAWRDVDFGDGLIEVDVASVLAPDAPSYARGFIGVAFRIDAAKRFESIYLRPLNSRVDDQVRRNHTIQYAAYPDYTFPRLRKEEPEKYECYADIAVEEWIAMRIEVRGIQARLFLNNAPQPSLIVPDLKLGANQRGGVGLWIEAGTIGHFSGLTIRTQ